MKKLINFCSKYRKIIYLLLTVVILLLLSFPLRKTVFPYGSKKTISDYNPAFIGDKYYLTPHFFASFYWIFNIKYSTGLQIFNQEIASFFFLLSFIGSLIGFWVYELKNKKGYFCLPLIFAFLSFVLVSFKNELDSDLSLKIAFILSPSFIVFTILITLYGALWLFFKLYPNMKVSEAFGKVADKVRSHKSKSQRIEELERQNAEIQQQLDELKRKD